MLQSQTQPHVYSFGIVLNPELRDTFGIFPSPVCVTLVLIRLAPQVYMAIVTLTAILAPATCTPARPSSATGLRFTSLLGVEACKAAMGLLISGDPWHCRWWYSSPAKANLYHRHHLHHLHHLHHYH